jgi:hypothetical protein
MVLATTLFAAGLALQAQESEVRTARLTPSPVELATALDLTGSGSARALLTENTLIITGTFEGLQAPATEANLHAGTKGLRGPVVAVLELDGSIEGTLRARLKLSNVQVDYLKQERLYIQLQNEESPEGLLRGWLVQPED